MSENNPSRLSVSPTSGIAVDPVVDISVIVPVFEDEDSVAPFLRRLQPVLEKIGSSEILFCLDPSPDRSEEVIREEMKHNPAIGLLVFSRRLGQPGAVMAGISNCSGDSCVVIDVDLQDPPELILDLHAKLKEGYDVVYAARNLRRGENWIKLLVSSLGYRIINKTAHVDIPRNTGDFRIMSRRVVDALGTLKEGHGFLRGLVALVGFDQTSIIYDRDERAHGRSKYNRFFGSFRIGLNGLIGFSNFLLQATLVGGLIMAFLALVGIVMIVVNKLVLGTDYAVGIPTVSVLVLFLGGVQLVSVGILGEYIGRIYDEVKQRPPYFLDKVENVRAFAGGNENNAPRN